MSDARLVVQSAGPLVTIQDGGRVGYLRYGVPASGPMDGTAFAAANAALGNSLEQTSIEISMGGLVLECKAGAVSIAVAGGNFTVECAGAKTSGWVVLTLYSGDRLSIRSSQQGGWAYLAIAGDLKTRQWLGHSATLSTTGFGGGMLRNGQEILVEQASVRTNREGGIERPSFLTDRESFRVVMHPQKKWFRQNALDSFQNTKFSITDSFDRMGVRLEGVELPLQGALSIPSEPIVRGSIQVSGEGVATILLADHQTSGGYPKIATLVSADIDTLVQKRIRDQISFLPVSSTTAVEIARQFSTKQKEYLHKISRHKESLSQQLMEENLISGVVYDDVYY